MEVRFLAKLTLALFVYYGLFGCGDNDEEMKNDLKITLLGV